MTGSDADSGDDSMGTDPQTQKTTVLLQVNVVQLHSAVDDSKPNKKPPQIYNSSFVFCQVCMLRVHERFKVWTCLHVEVWEILRLASQHLATQMQFGPLTVGVDTVDTKD